jgi:hypothetical protein
VKDWGISPWRVLVLTCVLMAIVVIVVIPDEFDLPDTAFHGGTAPLVVHSRNTSVPALLAVSLPAGFLVSPETRESGGDFSLLSAPSVSLSVLVSLRC